MKDANYKVQRDNIYVGKLIEKTTDLIKYEEGSNEANLFGNLKLYGYFPYRTMIFTIDDNNMANDLLYNSPNYPILNVSDDQDCINSKILVKSAYPLNQLLEYFHYNEQLFFSDIKEIRENFFDGFFPYDNCELFGYEVIKKEKNSDDNYLLAQLKKIRDRFKIKEIQYVGNGVFSKRTYDILVSLGDRPIMFEANENAFIPYESEGKIKRLKK